MIPALGGAERKIATVYPVHSWDRPFPNLSGRRTDGGWPSAERSHPRVRVGIWLIAADGQERRQLTEGPRAPNG